MEKISAIIGDLEEIKKRIEKLYQKSKRIKELVENDLKSYTAEEFVSLVCEGDIDNKQNSIYQCAPNNWLWFKRKQYYTEKLNVETYERRLTYNALKKYNEENKPQIRACIYCEGAEHKISVDCPYYNANFCKLAKRDYFKKERKEEDYL